MQVRVLLLLGLLSMQVTCGKPGEPVTRGRYFIDNRLDLSLNAIGTSDQGPSVDFTDSIPAHTKSLFMEVTEGSGGHVLPSNFLTTFLITNEAGDTVYTGVHNEDWERDQPIPSRADLILVIE